MLAMFGVVVFPEAVLDAVETDFDELEVVPLGMLHVMTDNLEVLPGHREDLLPEPLLVVGAEVFHVHRIVADEAGDLVLDVAGANVLIPARVGGEEAADRQAVDFSRREVGRNADDVRPVALPADLVPDGQFADGRRVDNSHLTVGMIGPVAEPIDSERPGILAGGHAHPRRYGDRRQNAFQTAVAANLHQPAEVVQAFIREQDLGGGAVEANDEDFHSSVSPLHGRTLGDAKGGQNRWGEIEQRCVVLLERLVHEQDAGNQSGIDNMIAAPLLDVVLEHVGRHTAKSRRPRGAVLRGEVHHQVRRFVGVRAGIEFLARHHTPDRGGPRPRIRQRAPGAAAISALSRSASSAGTMPCPSRPRRLM